MVVDPDTAAHMSRLLQRCTFAAPGPVTCAVSGGADSVALLALAIRWGHEVHAIHVDHGLRDGSGAEADVVAAATTRFGAGFEAITVEVKPGSNLEARARAARYGPRRYCSRCFGGAAGTALGASSHPPTAQFWRFGAPRLTICVRVLGWCRSTTRPTSTRSIAATGFATSSCR
jgi:hypothetical protein